MLTIEQKRIFARRGFIVIERFFTEAEMASVSTWLDALCERAPGAGTEARYFERSPLDGKPVLVRAEHLLGGHNPAITALLVSRKTTACVLDLLGEPPVLFKDKVNFKLPGSRPDKLHQDQAAGWNAYADVFVTMAIAVDENRADNAGLTFLSSGNYDHELMGDEWRPLTDDDPPYEPPEQYTLVEANPGDVILFDSYVPHGSPPNTSEQRRRNIYLTFNRRSAGDLRRRYYQDKWAVYPPNDGLEVRDADARRV
jgi:hypothetical protein